MFTTDICFLHADNIHNTKLILISGFCDDVMHNLEDDNRASHHGDTRTLHVLLCYNNLFSINNMNIQHSKSIFIISSNY